tara:strand:- start:66286 stop:66735 length:450 start_codon:yes stop_codon:yes gene_type:complete
MEKEEIIIINKSDNQDPDYETLGSAGFDLRSNEEVIILPKEIVLVGTGLHFQLPLYLEIQVRPRSGLALKHSITVLNSPGTIDSDYQGEVKVILINHGDRQFKIEKGDRIAQAVMGMVFGKQEITFKTVEGFDNITERGTGGFGSTGVK